MARFVFRRRVGIAAALIAAYALVFNVVLTSVLVASTARVAAAAAHELCIGGGDTDAARSDADKSGKIAIHCPLCVGHHVAAGLLPPQPALVDRVPVAARTVVAFQARVLARARSFDHQSRGPPGLI
ncbi:DUF2946 family protein [Bradyrhizobium sp. LA6.12]|uniref:DUF2946 family protein n=1 Tax=unclassified Bradyrhizobium TaxID=2631580 RepID=UPI00339B6524